MNEYYRAPGADDDFSKHAQAAAENLRLRNELAISDQTQKTNQLAQSITTIALHESPPTKTTTILTQKDLIAGNIVMNRLRTMHRMLVRRPELPCDKPIQQFLADLICDQPALALEKLLNVQRNSKNKPVDPINIPWIITYIADLPLEHPIVKSDVDYLIRYLRQLER